MLGIFDSGIGGLTVVKELLKRAPNASFVYLGDTARTPYGNKSAEMIKQYAKEDVAFLVGQGAKDIIIACNSVSAIALDTLKEAYPNVRFFDVVTPAVQAATEATPSPSTSPSGRGRVRKIGVIGTRATISSGIYEERIKAVNKETEVLSQACPLFVPLVEEGWTRHPETKKIVRRYLSLFRQKQIDVLILGCTHYPLLQSVIRASLQRKVKIIDSPSALLDQIQKEAPDVLHEDDDGQNYYFTDTSALTDKIASQWLQRTIKGEKVLLG